MINTLTVYVDGIAWREVSSFYEIGPDEQVYVLRQGDEGETRIHFGDGRFGARLPTGTANVLAYYRHGAGYAAPPANSITQLAKPVKGLTSAIQPLAATGGADAESKEQLRELAPASALLLGRAISIEDMQVVAASVPGVDAADAQWRWQATQQRPAVQVEFIGDAEIDLVQEKLQLLTTNTTPISVNKRVKFPLGLSLDVEVDPSFIQADVLSAVQDKLSNQDTGTLLPENIGLRQPIFRSQVFADVLSVPGVTSVKSMLILFLWFEIPWSMAAIDNVDGYVWDFTAGGVRVNGWEGNS